MLRVCLLGRPRVFDDGAVVRIGGRPKTVPLLAYLLLHRGGALPRAAVAAALWPDDRDADARANLRRHVNYLQHLLPRAPADRPWLLVDASTLRWNPDAAMRCDVEEFAALAAIPARRADAIALYAGDVLADADEEWLEEPRARLRAVYHATLTAVIAATRAARDLPGTIAAAQALLAADPWREDAVRALVRSRYDLGDRAAALAEYERFAAAIRAELGAEPMAETVALYDAIRRDDALRLDVAPAAGGPAPGAAALPFCGRDAELAEVRERWRIAAAGAGGLVLIGGEAGVGKTRFVRELAAACEGDGALVYEAAASFPEAVPLQPHAALVRDAAPLAATLRVDVVWFSALAALVPSLGAHVPNLPALPAVDPARERTRLFEAYAHFWEAIAARRPVVAILEDVHWSGAATVALLEHAARAAQRHRILIVATYREDDLNLAHPLRAARRRLEAAGAAVHVALGRLGVDAVGGLVRALGAADDVAALARALHARSEGNPFVLGEVLRDLDESGALRVVDGAWLAAAPLDDAVPPAVRDALAARLGRLDERAAALADVAAVAGTFEIELAREVTGWTEAAVLDALGTLIDRRVIADGGARGHAFTHHLIRTVIYDAMPAAERLRRHRRVAHVMTALYRDQREDLAATIALHWERGGEHELAAAAYLTAARRAQSVYAGDEARAHAGRVLALGASAPVRFAALLLREQVAAARGERDLQASDLDALTALARDLRDDDAICTVLERRVELMNVVSDRRRERVLLALLRRKVRASRSEPWLLRVLEAEARFARVSGDFDGARRAVAQLVDAAEAAGDRGAFVKARLALADSFIYEGRLREASAALEALRDAVRAEDNQSAWVRTLMAFARASLMQQDYAAMTSFAQEALAVSSAIGDREGEALALHTLANGFVTTFAIGDAEAAYARALALYERIDHRVGIASISVDLGLFHTELGLLDRALEWYARARAAAEEIGFRWVACVEAVNRSYALRLRGALVDARAAAEAALATAREIGAVALESAALGTLGVAACELGDVAAAIEYLERGVALRRPAGSTPRLGDNLCGLARARLAAGDVDAAARAARELLALYDANPKMPAQPTEWLWTIAQVEHARTGAAGALLRRAASVMQARALAVADAATRDAYLALPFNRAITAAAPLATASLRKPG